MKSWEWHVRERGSGNIWGCQVRHVSEVQRWLGFDGVVRFILGIIKRKGEPPCVVLCCNLFLFLYWCVRKAVWFWLLSQVGFSLVQLWALIPSSPLDHVTVRQFLSKLQKQHDFAIQQGRVGWAVAPANFYGRAGLRGPLPFETCSQKSLCPSTVQRQFTKTSYQPFLFTTSAQISNFRILIIYFIIIM